jgi:hypothetical protein
MKFSVFFLILSHTQVTSNASASEGTSLRGSSNVVYKPNHWRKLQSVSSISNSLSEDGDSVSSNDENETPAVDDAAVEARKKTKDNITRAEGTPASDSLSEESLGSADNEDSVSSNDEVTASTTAEAKKRTKANKKKRNRSN